MASQQDLQKAKQISDTFFQAIKDNKEKRISYQQMQEKFYLALRHLPAQFFLDPNLTSIMYDKSRYGQDWSAISTFTVCRMYASNRIREETK
jgi:hypothetical protein